MSTTPFVPVTAGRVMAIAVLSLLAPTRADTRDGGTGRGAGFNDVYLSASFVPSDDPAPRTLIRATAVAVAAAIYR